MYLYMYSEYFYVSSVNGLSMLISTPSQAQTGQIQPCPAVAAIEVI